MRKIKKVAIILMEWCMEASEYEIVTTLFTDFNIPISNKTLYKIKSQKSYTSFKHFKK